MSATETETPRVYVACLASYNASRLHGAWIDATDVDEIWEGIRDMLASSPIPGAEEWAIHDYDNFGSLRLGEHEDIERVAEVGALIDEHGEAFAAYANHVGVDCASAEGFEDAYCGEWDSEQAYAEKLFDELYGHELADHVVLYVDYESFARDLFLGDYFAAPSPGVFVFRRC